MQAAQYFFLLEMTETATSAWEQKWQGLLAEDALAKLYTVQKSLVAW